MPTAEQQQFILEALGRLSDWEPGKGKVNVATLKHHVVPHLNDAMPEQLFMKALRILKVRGLVDSIGMAEDPIRRCGLTPNGVRHLVEGKDLSDPADPEGGGNTYYTFNGTTNYQQGNGNTQNINFDVSTEQVEELIRALREDGNGDLADEVEQVTECGKEPRRIGPILRKIVMAAVEAGASAATTGAFASLFT